MNTNKKATGSSSKRLLAALAVLAVAFVVFAAVPAVATDSDAVTEANPAPAQPTNAVDWSDIEGSGTGYTYSSGTLTVSTGVAITVDEIITSSLTISKAASASGNITVYMILPAEGSTHGSSTTNLPSTRTNGMFDGQNSTNAITLTINSGVNLVLLDGRSAMSGVNIAQPMMIFTNLVVNNANVWFESAKTATTKAFDGGSITMVGGQLIGHCNGISIFNTLSLTSGAKIIVEDNQYRTYSEDTHDLSARGTLYIDASVTSASIARGSSITITDGYTISVAASKSLDIQGTVTGDVYLNSGATLTVKDGGSYTGAIGARGSGDYNSVRATSMMAIETSLTSTDSTGLSAKLTQDASPYLTLSGKGTVGDTSVAYGAYYYNSDTDNGAADNGADLRIYGDDISVAAGATISVDRSGSLSTESSKLSLGNGSKIVLDADQKQPVTFVSSGTSSISSGSSGITQNSGSITLSTGSFNVGTGYGMTLDEGTFTIAKGAAIKVNGDSGLSVTSGSVVNNGVIAYSGSIPTGAPLTALKITGNEIVKAYGVGATTDTISGVESISLGPDTVAYAGETIDVDVSADNHYKLTAVAYYAADDSNKTILARATDNGDGTWSFVMPAKGVLVTASAVGAYTATFLEVDDATGKVIGQTESDPLTNAKDVPVPAISVNGYTVGGYYKEKALYNAYTISGTNIDVSDDDLYSSVTIYVKMLKQYTITYADVEGGEVYGAIQAQSGTDVSVTEANDSGYKFKADSVTAVYTDASGKQVTITAKVDSTDPTRYTFKMPAADVIVSATFDKLYTATFDKQSSEDPKSTVTIGSTTNVSDVIETQAIKNGKVKFFVSSITTNYAVSGFTFKDTAGNELEIDVTETTTAGEYTFKMPGQDVTVSVNLGKAYALLVSSADNGKTVATTSAGQTINEGDTGKLVAVNADVAIAVTPDKNKALKTISVVATGDITKIIEPVLSNGVYMFKMPEYAVTVSTEYADAYSVSGVGIKSGINGGSVNYDQNAAKAIAAGNTLSFAIQLRAGYSLTSIEATVPTSTTGYTAATGSGATLVPATISITPNVARGVLTTYDMVYPSAGINASMFTYDKETGTVTMLMPAANVTSVVFSFGATTYYTITLNAGEAGSIVLYSDAACTEVLEDAKPDIEGFQVESGTTVFMKVAADGDGTIESINATYQEYVPASGSGSTAVPAYYKTSELTLGIVSSLNTNDDKFGIYSFEVIGDTTINATFAKSDLQIAKEDATKYIQDVQASASMSETIIGHDATWAAQADADAKIFANALSAVASATTIADVQKAQNDFDSRLLAYLKETSASYLETAYNNGEALDGKLLSIDAYNNATNAIAAVQLDDDKTVQDEADAVVAAYDAAMDSRTDVNPTPAPAGAATQVLVGFYGEGQIMIVGVDGYVPAGEIVLSLTTITATGASYTFTATLAVSNDDQKTTLTIALDADELEVQSGFESLMSSVYAVSIHYEAGSVVSAETPVSTIKLQV